jgi:hypothetical protein
MSLHRAVTGPRFTLLLCGGSDTWDAPTLARLEARHSGLLQIRRLEKHSSPTSLSADDRVFALLAAQSGAQYLIRPDGYIAFRCRGTDLDGLIRYLGEWFR